MRYLGHAIAMIAALLAAPVLAQTAHNAPVNLAPNSQWEVMSGWGLGTQVNPEGTGTAAPISASGNSTGSIGRATFSVTTTNALSVGDLVQASGPGIDPCFAISPMRVVALAANRSITVRTPFGCTPAVSRAATLLPVTAGNQSITGTGSGPDGWLKTITMPMWRNEKRGPYAANMPGDIGAYAAIGMRKDIAAPEHFYIYTSAQNLAKFQGRTVVFGIYGYQKVRGGPGTWAIHTNDSVNGARTPCAGATRTAGYQWLECSFTVPAATSYFHVGVQLNGAASDTYYFVNPVLAIGNMIGGVQYYQKPQGEILIPQVHISPLGWIDARIAFPASAAEYCGPFPTCFEHDLYAESGGIIAPTVVKCHGQMEGINPGPVVSGSGHVRVMAWYDRAAAPEKSGSFLSHTVSNVKSFAFMDFPLNQTDTTPDLLGTGIYASNLVSDTWVNVSEEVDWCMLD